MHDRTRYLLKQIGLSPREIQAVGLPPLHQITDRPEGFGLLGGNGAGKTWHMANRIGMAIQAMVDGCPNPAEARMPNRFARWRNWPDTAETFKAWVGQGFTQDVEDLVDQLCSCRELYLDDLGQERIAKVDDYALGFLRNILDARYRDNLPVFWTSNLVPVELGQTYGARTASRMLSAWPPIPVRCQDLRLGGRVS